MKSASRLRLAAVPSLLPVLLSISCAARGETLETVVVTAAPPDAGSSAPAQVFEGPRLDVRRASTIGETLSELPGVVGSAFGPNASRPVVRGLDGERLRVLSNGMPLLDASAASPDHAVAAESLLLDRVELLRGPAALRRGGSPLGAAIDLVDGRIPEQPVDGVTAQLDLRAGGAASESAGTVRVDGGDGRVAWHASALSRRSDDLSIPGFARTAVLRGVEPDSGRDVRGRLANSAARAEGVTVGVSRTSADGHAGLALSQLGQRYGTTLFEGGAPIAIDLDQTRLDGSLRQAGVAGGTLAARAAVSSYRHAELAGSEVGTRFDNRGGDGRLEWTRHVDRTRWSFGGQLGSQRLRVQGDEAFLPATRTDQAGLWALAEHAARADLRLVAGVRVERVGVDSAGDRLRGDWSLPSAVAGADGPGAVAGTRRFVPVSGSVSATWTALAGQAFAATLSHAQRAPNAQELFADGVHAATGLYEIGDPSLRPERANGVDLGWRRTAGALRARVDLFAQRFDRWIGLRGVGEATRAEDGESMTAAAFTSTGARFRGAEIDLAWTVYERAGQRLTLEAGHDRVRATDDAGGPLPRIPAARWRLGAGWRDGAWSARLDVIDAQRVTRITGDETSTPGWTRVDASVAWAFARSWRLQLVGRNLGDAVIREHASFLKDVTVAGGRAVLVALRGVI